MSFDFPASVERDIHQYAEAERISPAEAATKLIRDALKAKKRRASKGELTDEEWQSLREIPTFVFLENLPDSAFDCIEAAYKSSRSERFKQRA